PWPAGASGRNGVILARASSSQTQADAMNVSISLSSNPQLTLSASRIEKLMNSDIQQATKLSTFDKVLDFFLPQSRETALRELHQMLHDGATSNFARFDALSRLATPE